MSKLSKSQDPNLSSEPIILSVDTSTKVCSAAIHIGGKLVANIETHTENSHAENLTVMVKNLANLAKVPLKRIDAFALAKGPGSYTGLRIGCSTLKGLCFSFDKPLIAISTLRILAEGHFPFLNEGLMCPMIDARRMEVYTALYNKKGTEVMIEQPLVLAADSFDVFLKTQKVFFVGDGSLKFAELFYHTNASFFPNAVPLAQHMGALALEKFQNEEFEDLPYFEPDYLKEFYTTAKVS